MSLAQRFIGAETLPYRMSEVDVPQFFSLSKDDISAICEPFRDDLVRPVELRPRGRMRSRCPAQGRWRPARNA